MTYQEFKRQLYFSLLELEAAEEAEIGILEKNVIYEDKTALDVIAAVTLSEQGKERGILNEDLLYAVWGEGRFDNMLYWPVRSFFEKYKSEGWQGVLPKLAFALNRDKVKKHPFPTETDTYEQHKSDLILRPISLKDNREGLEDCIYWLQGDIALVLYLLVYDDRENLISVKMGRNMTESWRKKDEVLLTGALLNCFSRMPPRLYKGQDSLKFYDESAGVFMHGEEGIPTEPDCFDRMQGMIGYRLTTSRRTNGAIAIFYPGVRERLSELLGGDYYVAFTGTDEAVIHPVRHKKLSDLKAAVHHNNAMLGAEKVLSGKVYRYLTLRNELTEV